MNKRIEVAASSGIKLILRGNIPAREQENAWWGIVRTGEPPTEENRVNWTNAGDTLLAPPGLYDIVKKSDNSEEVNILKREVAVPADKLVELEI